jgi:hypothetical protein
MLYCNPHCEVTQPECRKKEMLLKNHHDTPLMVEVEDGSRMTLDENEQKGFISLYGELDVNINA